MKTVAPRYLRDFKCIADKCRHSCCIGWEIDVDADSLEYYQSIEGEFGRRLKDNIAIEQDCAHFTLGKDERCPFLNACGLCDIYTELGEDALCQICTDHPRFYNEIAGRLEMGVGLCCEAAAELVLCSDEPFTLEVWEDDGEEQYSDPFEQQILQERENLLSLVQSGASLVTLPDEIVKMDWCTFYSSLERLDPLWSEALSGWKNAPPSAWNEPMAQFDKEFRNLICYFLYRHLPGAEDLTDLQARIQFAFLSYRVVRVLAPCGKIAPLRIFSTLRGCIRRRSSTARRIPSVF